MTECVPEAMPAVAAYGLRVRRGTRPVLRDVSFTVGSGNIAGLVGPSGCGKTTLMRTLVGSQPVSAGHAQVLGLPAGDGGLSSRVGYVTQAPSVYRDLTVLQNLRYFAAALELGGWRKESAVVRVIDDVGLAGCADRPVGRLSGGQYSRVSLAVALLGEPALLVMDEPTVGLDPLVRRDIWAMFRRLADTGTTLLVSSHVMDEADRCDQLLLMRDGRLLAAAGRRELLARTGAGDVEEAFLRLVDEQERGTAAPADDGPVREPGAVRDTVPAPLGRGT